MSLFLRAAQALLLLVPLAPAVAAPLPVSQPDPADPSVPVPALRYESSLARYRALANDPPPPQSRWQQANEEVRRLGGHAGHAGPAVVPDPHAGHAPARAPADPAASPPAGGDHAH